MYRFPGQIDLLTIGKLKTKHWLSAQNDYEKRLRRYGKFALHELKDHVGRGAEDAIAMSREGDALLQKATGANRVILLTPTGKQMSSEGLARYVNEQCTSYGRIAFLIGGPLGFSADVYQAAHDEIGLSQLTFTHEMARVIFLEQLYRACTILNNEPYHK